MKTKPFKFLYFCALLTFIFVVAIEPSQYKNKVGSDGGNIIHFPGNRKGGGGSNVIPFPKGGRRGKRSNVIPFPVGGRAGVGANIIPFPGNSYF